ncbi:prolipoprotein diacylglyceryl transferase [Mycoplasmopsis caviae]|uniref:Phosphatidylglycerol--prolipoprotein diacylglyceryl transferase n=1 Tax=Mycoplasmopsis caviae TaxID=55603 RepID=A0A3P8KWG5_9BACT|nr:prolipoprotein diacylglyceryl transferase [Mycoplasmopsis caviae]UUD35476.1 prolipoprotein diacylglyceryl transferase [Mycoplasmopsis caviae]VDR41747.1 Prolipoprotein diacylglyceryl transferase [Mycoplasmopsis caviae]
MKYKNTLSPIAANTSVPLFKIGNWPIQVYSLTLMLGMIASILTIAIFWRREKYKWEYFLTLVLITVPSAIIGARLWDLVEEAIYNPNYNWSGWYKVWEGGLSIQGGVVLAFLLDIFYVYTIRDKVDIRKVASIIIPNILIGQVIGRWGNYANHEVYGKIDYTGASVEIWGRSFAQNMYISDSLGAHYRYPLFLYESLANLVGYIILVWIINQFGLLKPGSSAALYFIWYGLVRLAMEPLRQQQYHMYTVAAIVFIGGGMIAFLLFEFFNPTHYIRAWRKGRFQYAYAHPEKYIQWIEKTRIKFRNSKPISELGQ